MKQFILFIMLFQFLNVFSQVINKNTENKNIFKKPILEKIFNNLSLKTYGLVNYYNFDWQTEIDRRNAVDLERLNMYVKYKISEKIEVKTEIEFEHGGTGSTMEFDRFEEFGEFESDIEAGGEVLLEQLYIEFKIKDWFKIRAGRMEMYVGNLPKLDEPTDYFTGHRSSMETALLPNGWSEIGIQLLGIFGKQKKWSYKAYLINGLASSGFSSANWIARGYQKRFEMANAESFAGLIRLDYNLKNNGWLGFSSYFGETNKNRPKADLKGIEGHVYLADLHTSINIKKSLKIRAMVLYGHLQNALLIADANRNLSNNLNVKRTPVASDVLGAYTEIGFDIFSLTKIENMNLIAFGRYDFYDSMFIVPDGMFKNPRWKRNQITFGLNYLPHPNIVCKAHYSHRILGLSRDNIENTFVLGIGYTFKTKNY